MTPYLIHFSGKGATEDRIPKALADKGIRTIRAQNLSKLHLLAITKAFDAIIVDMATIRRYAMNPTRHLWEKRSRMSIIAWEADESGSITVTWIARPNTAIGSKRASRLAHVGAVVKNALMDIGAREQLTTANQERDSEAKPFHQGKIGTLYRLLKSSTTTGADIDHIREALWPGDARARRDDIQSYASKLRRILRVAYPGRYALIRDRNRYILKELS